MRADDTNWKENRTLRKDDLESKKTVSETAHFSMVSALETSLVANTILRLRKMQKGTAAMQMPIQAHKIFHITISS